MQKIGEFVCRCGSNIAATVDVAAVVEALKVQPHGNIALIAFKGTDSIEKAEKLRGRIIYINRNDANLPSGR